MHPGSLAPVNQRCDGSSRCRHSGHGINPGKVSARDGLPAVQSFVAYATKDCTAATSSRSPDDWSCSAQGFDFALHVRGNLLCLCGNGEKVCLAARPTDPDLCWHGWSTHYNNRAVL